MIHNTQSVDHFMESLSMTLDISGGEPVPPDFVFDDPLFEEPVDAVEASVAASTRACLLSTLFRESMELEEEPKLYRRREPGE